jgi:hypothetical protein
MDIVGGLPEGRRRVNRSVEYCVTLFCGRFGTLIGFGEISLDLITELLTETKNGAEK